jgi:hypothetical protein
MVTKIEAWCHGILSRDGNFHVAPLAADSALLGMVGQLQHAPALDDHTLPRQAVQPVKERHHELK